MLYLVVFGALVAFASGQTTQVTQCRHSEGEVPINTYVGGCDVPPCGLPQLEDAVINIVFRAPRTMHSMTTLAIAYLPGLLGIEIPIPYNLREKAVTCNFLDNSYCPVLEGEVLQYTLLMYIEPTFVVGIAPTIEFRIADESGESFLCLRVPVVILPSNTRRANATLLDYN
ncbi:uncharacterized protein LOC125228946 [Leguminivora glycinivorella]|uniref:uncharacterized protein LOC125228946 n=1 Tax=Leguminivora glycinivorella TaxID=1035111 RepID=UPI00200F7AAD|nr:uncharacterized protein LOC125228946 [Leguminivora glycinivorella]